MKNLIRMSVMLFVMLSGFLIGQVTAEDEQKIWSDVSVHGHVRSWENIYPNADTVYTLGDSLEESDSYLRWRTIFSMHGNFQHIWADSFSVAVFAANDTLILITSGNDTIRIDTIQTYWVYDGERKLRINTDSTLFSNNYIDDVFTLGVAASTQNAIRCSITTDAGSAANPRRAIKAVLMDGGWDGNSYAYAGYFNTMATPGKRNYGVFGWAHGDSIKNIGVKGEASLGYPYAVGVWGVTVDDEYAYNRNVGVMGTAINAADSLYYIAGYFGVKDSFPDLQDLAYRAVLLTDNGMDTCRHWVAVDSEFVVAELADIGDSTAEFRIMSATDTTAIRSTSMYSDSVLGIYGLFTGSDSVALNYFPDTALYVGCDDEFGVVSRTSDDGAEDIYAFYGFADSLGTGAKYGIYTNANGDHGGTADVFGGFFEAEGWGASTARLVGVYSKVDRCGTGSKIGFEAKVLADGANDIDTTIGFYMDVDSDGTNENNVFGYYGMIMGDAEDTLYGVLTKVWGGAVNYGGFHNVSLSAVNAPRRAFVCSTTTQGAGAAATQFGIHSTIEPGYTGTANTISGMFRNDIVGGAANAYNAGLYGQATADAPRDNYGVYGFAETADSTNIGVKGFAPTAETLAVNVGVLGIGNNQGGGTRGGVGGYFVYAPSIPIQSYMYYEAALVADNDTSSEYIFVGVDSKANVFEIVDDGDSTCVVHVIGKWTDTTFIYPTCVKSDTGDFTYLIGHSPMNFVGDTFNYNFGVSDKIQITTNALDIDDLNRLITDGQKAIWTDDSEADSLSIYVLADTTKFDSDNVIAIDAITRFYNNVVFDAEMLMSGNSIKTWNASELYLSGGTNTPGSGYIRTAIATALYWGTGVQEITINATSVVIDSLIVHWNNTDNGGTMTVDSIMLQEIRLNTGAVATVKSWALGDATTGFRSANVIQGGDYTMVDERNYRLKASISEAVDNNTVDIYGCKMVYHTE